MTRPQPGLGGKAPRIPNDSLAVLNRKMASHWGGSGSKNWSLVCPFGLVPWYAAVIREKSLPRDVSSTPESDNAAGYVSMVPVAQVGMQLFPQTLPFPLALEGVQLVHTTSWTPVPLSAQATVIEVGSTCACCA
jgi:hypothetical protein